MRPVTSSPSSWANGSKASPTSPTSCGCPASRRIRAAAPPRRSCAATRPPSARIERARRPRRPRRDPRAGRLRNAGGGACDDRDGRFDGGAAQARLRSGAVLLPGVPARLPAGVLPLPLRLLGHCGHNGARAAVGAATIHDDDRARKYRRPLVGAERTMKVLVVEDDSVLSAALTRALNQAGYAVDLCEDGDAANAALAAADYDLVVLDVALPKVDGLAVLKRLRDRRSRVPVLILTARDTLEERVAGLDMGADDYMTKPF